MTMTFYALDVSNQGLHVVNVLNTLCGTNAIDELKAVPSKMCCSLLVVAIS